MSLSAVNAAKDACYWVKAHPREFKALMSVIHRQVDEGNPCVKQGELEFYARKAGMEVDVAGCFRFDRNLYPALTRYMVMLRPRLARAINFRKSGLDGIDLVGIWHEVVDAGTAFIAGNRMEAERMVELDDAGAA